MAFVQSLGIRLDSSTLTTFCVCVCVYRRENHTASPCHSLDLNTPPKSLPSVAVVQKLMLVSLPSPFPLPLSLSLHHHCPPQQSSLSHPQCWALPSLMESLRLCYRCSSWIAFLVSPFFFCCCYSVAVLLLPQAGTLWPLQLSTCVCVCVSCTAIIYVLTISSQRRYKMYALYEV